MGLNIAAFVKRYFAVTRTQMFDCVALLKGGIAIQLCLFNCLMYHHPGHVQTGKANPFFFFLNLEFSHISKEKMQNRSYASCLFMTALQRQ